MSSTTGPYLAPPCAWGPGSPGYSDHLAIDLAELLAPVAPLFFGYNHELPAGVRPVRYRAFGKCKRMSG